MEASYQSTRPQGHLRQTQPRLVPARLSHGHLLAEHPSPTLTLFQAPVLLQVILGQILDGKGAQSRVRETGQSPQHCLEVPFLQVPQDQRGPAPTPAQPAGPCLLLGSAVLCPLVLCFAASSNTDSSPTVAKAF